jgi:VanZ family protein
MPAGRTAVPLAIVATLLPALALFAALPSRPMILSVLNDAAHAPVFALLTLVLLRLLGILTTWARAARIAAASVLSVAVGGGVEALQSLIGRDAEWSDLTMDAFGAAAAIGIAIAAAGRRWIGGALFVVAAGTAFWPLGEACLAYLERQRQFPVVMDFDSRLDWYFLRSQGVAIDTSAGCMAFQITGGRWPGVSHLEPQPDWRGRTTLTVDVSNLGHDALGLTLRVHDISHDNRADDRFNRRFELAPGAHERIAVPLAEIAAGPRTRRMDLGRIAGLILFAEDSVRAGQSGFCVHRIVLT